MDENNYKLLKMTESLLKADKATEKSLSSYKSITSKIDTEKFNSIFDSIKKIANNNLTLQEELIELEKIQDEYSQLELFQHRVINTYSQYSNDKLELSDLEKLQINKVIDRINAISGYLLNEKKIDENRNRLEELNKCLISENKKYDVIKDRIKQYEDELETRFLNAEGRKLVGDSIEYTSIQDEYKALDIDIREYINNSDLIDEVLTKLEKNKIDMDEELAAAQLCYDKSSTFENKNILSNIWVDAIKSRYSLSLIKILKLISIKEDTVDGALVKRAQLLDLIRYRCDCLSKLNYKISIDPFGRLKIDNQLELIKAFGNVNDSLSDIRKEIGYLSSQMDEMKNQNLTFLREINKNIFIIADDKKVIESDFNMNDLLIHEEVLPNQVVGISDKGLKFKTNIVKEKTDGVIKRVIEIMNGKEYNNVIENQIPELVIEDQSPKTEATSTNLFVNEEPFTNEQDSKTEATDTDLFVNEEPFVNQQSTNNEMLTTSDNTNSVFVADDKKDDIFTEVTPFSEPSLFSDKLDSDLFVDNKSDYLNANVSVNSVQTDTNIQLPDSIDISDNIEMPEVFWETQPEQSTSDNSDGGVSLDDQINELISVDNKNDDVKTRKLVM